MEKDISKDMYFLYKKILKQIPKKGLDDDVDTSFLEKDIISFLYKFFETNYFNYPNKRDLPHFDICNVAVQDDGNVGAQAFYSEESKTIYLDGHDIFEIAHGKRKFGDLLNSLGHEFRHFLQYRAKESDFITKTGKESYKFLETSLFGYYYQLFEEDLAMDNGLKELEKFCKKDSVKESKFAKFVSKTIKETGLYAYTIYAGQDASQLHEEDARLAGLVFCADFYNRMIRESFNRGDKAFEKILKQRKEIDVKDSVEYTEEFAEKVNYFDEYINVLKEEPADFFIKLAVEAYTKGNGDLIYFLNKTLNDKCLLSSPEQLQNLVSDILLSWDIQDEQLKKMVDFSKENELTEEQQKRLDKCEKSELAQRNLFAYVLENDAFKNKDLIFYPNEEKIVKNMAKYDMKRFKKIPTLKKQNFFNEVSK